MPGFIFLPVRFVLRMSFRLFFPTTDNFVRIQFCYILFGSKIFIREGNNKGLLEFWRHQCQRPHVFDDNILFDVIQ